MKDTGNGVVNPQKDTVTYEEVPISIKLTKKTKEMLDYIQNKTQISKSSIIRLSISKYYDELKREDIKNDL